MAGFGLQSVGVQAYLLQHLAEVKFSGMVMGSQSLNPKP